MPVIFVHRLEHFIHLVDLLRWQVKHGKHPTRTKWDHWAPRIQGGGGTKGFAGGGAAYLLAAARRGHLAVRQTRHPRGRSHQGTRASSGWPSISSRAPEEASTLVTPPARMPRLPNGQMPAPSGRKQIAAPPPAKPLVPPPPWILGPNGPTLSEWGVSMLDLRPQQIDQVNKVLKTMHEESRASRCSIPTEIPTTLVTSSSRSSRIPPRSRSSRIGSGLSSTASWTGGSSRSPGLTSSLRYTTRRRAPLSTRPHRVSSDGERMCQIALARWNVVSLENQLRETFSRARMLLSFRSSIAASGRNRPRMRNKALRAPIPERIEILRGLRRGGLICSFVER